MELNHLHYFYQVAKAGSFTAAARSLRVSQPSLSKAVALLEAREEVKLLERSKSGVSLTALGEEVYAKCEKIFNSLREVENTCQQSRAICEGPLRFGASDHIANYLLVKKLIEMNKHHPAVTPSLFVGAPQETVKLVLKKELEFALFFTIVEHESLVYEEYLKVPLVAVYSPKFQLDLRRGQYKKLPGGQIGSIKNQFKIHPAKEVFEEIDEKAEVTFETNSQECQKRLALAGAGIAVLTKFMVEEELKRGQLLEIPLSKNKEAQMYIVKRKHHTLTLAAENV